MRVSEIYPSTQGEGPNVGETTVFVRFGGCNLRCPGWPCDTDHAINPAFRKEWTVTSPEELLVQTFARAKGVGANLITLTGGEPFLQKNSDLHMFVDGLLMSGFRVEAFTNGTFLYPEWALDNVSMIMDWKLKGSGEDPYNTTRIDNLHNLDKSVLKHSVKFVCKNTDDFELARDLYLSLEDSVRTGLNWYYGKVWNGDVNDAELVHYVMKNKLPWKLNVQVHNYIWDPHERGR